MKGINVSPNCSYFDYGRFLTEELSTQKTYTIADEVELYK